jgi:hypothetical protein
LLQIFAFAEQSTDILIFLGVNFALLETKILFPVQASMGGRRGNDPNDFITIFCIITIFARKRY